MAVREELAARWLATQRRVSEAGVKRVCYLSVEFLLGRSLINGLASLDGDLVAEARAALAEMDHDLDRIAEEETDPGLGNGGRLAACYLDSLATLQFPRSATASVTTTGSSPRRSTRMAASARSQAAGFVTTTRGRFRDDASYVIRFGGRCVTTQDAQGIKRTRWAETHNIWAVAYDQLIPATAARPSITCGSGPVARSPRSMSRHSTPGTTDASAAQADAKASRGCCTRTTRRRRARSCASSSSTSS